MPRISVVIPALNEERVIGTCLKALSEVDLPRSSLEVILVDNGSKDRTVEIARSFEGKLNLRILEKKAVHISAMRNAGAQEARSEILAFLDADCIVPQNWLSRAVSLLADPRAGIVGAHYEIPSDSTWVGRVWYQDRMANRAGDVKYVPAGDLILGRDVFMKVGGFDETIQTNEDFELCQRVLGAGFPVRSHPELRVIHLGTPRTLLSFYRKQKWHGTHVLTVFLRDLRKGRNLRPVLFSLFTLLCLTGMLLGIAAVIAGFSWKWVAISAVALVLPLLLLAGLRSAARGAWGDLLPATLLYLTFGVARAMCLLDFKAWTSPWKRASRQEAKK